MYKNKQTLDMKNKLHNYLLGKATYLGILACVVVVLRMKKQKTQITRLLILQSIGITTLHVAGVVIILIIHILCTKNKIIKMTNSFQPIKITNSERLKANLRWFDNNGERWLPPSVLICMIYNNQNYTSSQILSLSFSIFVWEMFLWMTKHEKCFLGDGNPRIRRTYEILTSFCIMFAALVSALKHERVGLRELFVFFLTIIIPFYWTLMQDRKNSWINAKAKHAKELLKSKQDTYLKYYNELLDSISSLVFDLRSDPKRLRQIYELDNTEYIDSLYKNKSVSVEEATTMIINQRGKFEKINKDILHEHEMTRDFSALLLRDMLSAMKERRYSPGLKSLFGRLTQTCTEFKDKTISNEQAMDEFRLQRSEMKKIMDDLGITRGEQVMTNTHISFAEEHGIVISYTFEPRQWNNLIMKELFDIYLSEKVRTQGNVSLKSFRFKHNGKILFISSIGHRSPSSLGLKDGDKIFVYKYSEPKSSVPTPKKQSPKMKKKQKGGGRKIKSKNKASNHLYANVDEEGKLRQLHSKAISRVHEEAESMHFKSIRQRLNDMQLDRTKPKIKKSRASKDSPSKSVVNLFPDGLGDKALKSRFVVHVGEVQNLYKSTKPSKRRKSTQASHQNISVDLHGLSKADALDTLDALLPQWIDVAMRGEYPWVISVVIVCGKGSQSLSEVVEDWIKGNERVANAPQNMH